MASAIPGKRSRISPFGIHKVYRHTHAPETAGYPEAAVMPGVEDEDRSGDLGPRHPAHLAPIAPATGVSTPKPLETT